MKIRHYLVTDDLFKVSSVVVNLMFDFRLVFDNKFIQRKSLEFTYNIISVSILGVNSYLMHDNTTYMYKSNTEFF